MEKIDLTKIEKVFKEDALFNTSVEDVLQMEDGQGTKLPKKVADLFSNVRKFEFGCSTYPFIMEDSNTKFIVSEEPLEFAPKTYEELVLPMCLWLNDIEESKQFSRSNHSLDEVRIETIKIGYREEDNTIGCTMMLGS
jgi:hypothetical protein